MAKKDKYSLNGVSLENIRNAYEKKVIEMMEIILQEFPDFDYCSLCIQDVYALSLNQLRPKYIQAGSILLPKDYDKDDFRKAIEFAIQKVIEKPTHNK